jgi:asparagine synthase (glutamine-hydrolysing)
MPGIAGIISFKKGNGIKNSVEKMVSCMMHEDFYNSGVYTNENLDIAVGWVSIKDSYADCMPVRCFKENIVLIFSGEIYKDNDGGVNSLNEKGNHSSQNGRFLIDSYSEFGVNFVAKLNGWFSGVLVDLHKEKIIIFNDRYAINRIYFHQDENGLIFSSEAKAILKVRNDLKCINLDVLGEYFAFGCASNNKSLFHGIESIPGGSLWVKRKDEKIKKESYFNPINWETKIKINEKCFVQELKETFQKILPRYFRSEEKIGISLTGGLDTRAILSHCTLNKGPSKTYTFAGLYRECHDVKIAKNLSILLGKKHYLLNLNRDFFENFENLASKVVYISDGCHDVCGAHDLFFNRLARQIAPIRLTGKFGSEVLRSASTFKKLNLEKRLFCPDISKLITTAENKQTKRFVPENLTFTCFEDIPNHEYGRLIVEQSQIQFRTPFLDNDLIELLYRAPVGFRTKKFATVELIDSLDSNLLSLPTDAGFYGKNKNVASNVVNITRFLSFKAEWYFNEGMPHWLSKINRICPNVLEDMVLGRHKIDHYRKWFKEKLKKYLKMILLDETTTRLGYFNTAFLNRMVNDHITGEKNYIGEINKAITVALIHNQLIRK